VNTDSLGMGACVPACESLFSHLSRRMNPVLTKY